MLHDSETHALSTNLEKQWQTAEFAESQGFKSRSILAAYEKYWRLITIVLLATIVVLQLAIWSAMGGNSARCSTQVGAEYQGLSPDCEWCLYTV